MMPNYRDGNSSNSELVHELINILKAEASLFETFLELMELQQKALVENDIEELNRITSRQREKAVAGRVLNKRREEVIGKLASDGAAREDITISRLIESVSSGQATILGQLRNSILDLNDRITRMRSQNEMLISRSQENIIKTMELLGRICAPDGNYQNQGRIKSTTTNIALDRRV